MSFVLLVGAGLVIRSLRADAHRQPRVFNRRRAGHGIDLVSAGYDPQRARTFQDELIGRLRDDRAASSRRRSCAWRRSAIADIRRRRLRWTATRRRRTKRPSWITTKSVPAISRHRHSSGHGTRVHAGRRRAVGAGGHRQRGDGRPVLARRRSGRPPSAGQRTIDARGGRRPSIKYGNLLEPTKAFFYVPLRQNSRWAGLLIRTPMRPRRLRPRWRGRSTRSMRTCRPRK